MLPSELAASQFLTASSASDVVCSILRSKVQLQVSVAQPEFIVVSLSQIAASTLLQPHGFPSGSFPRSAQLAVEHNLHV